jgi:Rrf2 family iron-sulfur cluster assembly transcriptional regulator
MRLEITRRSDLALRALRHLEATAETVRGADLAEAVASTAQYLPQVLNPLVRTGWVASDPGPGGGYRLAAPLQGRSVLELIELLEGETDTGVCVLRDGPCSGAERCSLHDAWVVSRGALVDILSAVPISARSIQS